MAYISLYRKWRPQSFAELIGQEHVARTLANAVDNNRVSHAYLFTGPRGTGKTSTAKILAKAANCQEGPTSKPCQKCNSCLRISDGSSLDVFEIDAASNRGIDEIRDLREKVNFVPSEGPKKVYIIDEVHMLTNEAFNALLKLLEEPPAHIIFILATTEPSKVLPTIISRCQRFDFRPILFSDLVKQLKKVAKAEKIKVEDEAFELIAKEARGGLRDGLGILDQLASYTSKEIKATDVIGLLGLVAGEKINRLIDIIISGRAGEIFTFTNDLIVEGVNLRQFTKELVDYGRNIFIIQNGGADKLINATTEEIETLKVHAKNLSKAQTRRLLNIFSQALTEMKNISDPQFILEMSCVKLMTPAADDDTDALRERLEKLERQLDNSHISVIPAPRETKKVTVKKIAPAKVVTDDEKITPKKVINKSRATSAGNMSLREVERFWPTIMAKIKGLSLPTHAILMECRPISVDNGKFIIDAGTDWRQELLKKPTKTAALKTALKNILGKDLNLVITVGAETNKNKVKPAATESPASALIEADDAVDDENLTLGLIKNSFGAEIVSEKNDTE